MAWRAQMDQRLDRLAAHYAAALGDRLHRPTVQRVADPAGCDGRQVRCAACGYGLQLTPKGEAIYVDVLDQGSYLCRRSRPRGDA